MNKPLSFACVLLLAASMPVPALDLTPHLHEIPFPDGSSLRRYYFIDGDTKYTIDTEHGTEVSASSGGAVFRYQDLPGASLVMQASPYKPEIPFNAGSLGIYRQSAESFAPNGAKAEGEFEETLNPISQDGWTSYRFSRAYKLPGSTIRQSVIFLNLLPKQQIVLVTTAFSAEFGGAQSRTERVITSWRSISDQKLNTPEIN